MNVRAMNRREFAQLTCLLLPVASPVAEAIADPPRSLFAFHDARFPRAMRYALGLDTGLHWRALGADVASDWRQQLQPALARGPLLVQGVTLSSVPFCLEVLARERAIARMTWQRIDRDLVHWTLEAQAHG